MTTTPQFCAFCYSGWIPYHNDAEFPLYATSIPCACKRGEAVLRQHYDEWQHRQIKAMTTKAVEQARERIRVEQGWQDRWQLAGRPSMSEMIEGITENVVGAWNRAESARKLKEQDSLEVKLAQRRDARTWPNDID